LERDEALVVDDLGESFSLLLLFVLLLLLLLRLRRESARLLGEAPERVATTAKIGSRVILDLGDVELAGS
jgi:hypothetical protein